MKRYTQKQLQEIFSDVPGKTLIYWAREGLVEWVEEGTDGRGRHRGYSPWNVFQVAVVRELAEMGIGFVHIRDVMDLYFKDFLQAPPQRHIRRGLKDRRVKASESDRLSKILVFGKHKVGRGWKSGDMFLVDPSEIQKELMEKRSDRAGFVMLDLSAIAKQIEDRVREMGLP